MNKDIFDRIMEWKFLRIFNPFYKKYKEVLLYLFFGGLTTVISIGSYAFFDVSMHMDPMIANIFSWILAVLFAYVTNKKFVFASKTTGMKELLVEFVKFVGGRVSTLIIELGGVQLAVILFPDSNTLLFVAKLLTQVLVIIINYFISKLFVFKGTKEASFDNQD